MHTLLERFYPETRFAGFTHIDGTIAFYTRVNALLKRTDVVLDIGQGRLAGDPTRPPHDFRLFKSSHFEPLLIRTGEETPPCCSQTGYSA
jgi:hypothetical protein